MKEKISSLLSKGNGLLSGGMLFFTSATIVNLGNYLFNLVLGRWLGPAAFSDLSIVITLFLIVIFFAATLQTITARFSAIHTSNNDLAQISILRKTMLRWSWVLGALLALVFILGATLWQDFFHTQTSSIFIIFGIGLPFYLAQGVNRGVLQGQTRFVELSASYQAEMWTRLITGVGFAWIGWGTIGAVVGLSFSFLATWLASQRAAVGLPKSDPMSLSDQGKLFSYTGGVSLTYLSQILITNSDIIIVKHFFSPQIAGNYAALALIGRVIYFATWAITTTTFPIVAQRNQSGKSHGHFLAIGVGLVFGLAAATILVAWMMPDVIVNTLFGEAYLNISPFLWRYAIAAGLYSLVNVFVNYQLSLGHKLESVLAFAGGLVQVLVLWSWHITLLQVVNLQIAIMAALLCSLVISYLWALRSRINPITPEFAARTT